MRWLLIWRIAWRNIGRNKVRNAISSTTVMLGVAVLIIGDSLVMGIDEMTIVSSEANITGHVLLRPTGYPTHGKDHPIDSKSALIPTEKLLATLHNDDVKAWTSRLWFRSRYIHVGSKDEAKSDDARFSESQIKVIAYHPETERAVFKRKRWTTTGQWPLKNNEIAVGSGLAKQYDIQVGDTARLLSRTRKGSQNAGEYQVSGIISADNLSLDQNTAWIRYSDAGTLTKHKGAVSHISLDLKAGRKGAVDWVSRFDSEDWEASTATEEVEGFLALNRFRKKALTFITFIVMAIAGTGMTNAIMMAAFERKGEIGALRAMGLSRKGVLALFLTEGMALGALASLLGGIIGGLTSWHLSTTGIDIAASSGTLGELPFSTLLLGDFSTLSIIKAMGFGVLVSIIASLYPASIMRKIPPARALSEAT